MRILKKIFLGIAFVLLVHLLERELRRGHMPPNAWNRKCAVALCLASACLLLNYFLSRG